MYSSQSNRVRKLWLLQLLPHALYFSPSLFSLSGARVAPIIAPGFPIISSHSVRTERCAVLQPVDFKHELLQEW